MVPALLLSYFVALIGILFIAGGGLTGWAAVAALVAVAIVDRELFQVRNLIDHGDETSDEPTHTHYTPH
jgi:hypothetical protein